MNSDIVKDEAYYQEMQCYGMRVADMEAMMEDSGRIMQPKMILLSMLSDAQEEISRGLDEKARLTLNRAKWLAHNYLTNKEEETA